MIFFLCVFVTESLGSVFLQKQQEADVVSDLLKDQKVKRSPLNSQSSDRLRSNKGIELMKLVEEIKF